MGNLDNPCITEGLAAHPRVLAAGEAKALRDAVGLLPVTSDDLLDAKLAEAPSGVAEAFSSVVDRVQSLVPGATVRMMTAEHHDGVLPVLVVIKTSASSRIRQLFYPIGA